MPWRERKPLEERRDFIAEWLRQEEPLAGLCRRYEISRPTAYKWIARYQTLGITGLEEYSRAPLHHPHAMKAGVVDRVLKLREKYPRWGPRKIRAYLQKQEPKLVVPAASSIGELLRKEGLSHARKKRRRTPRSELALSEGLAPNDLWCTDFKGWFLCGDGTRCDPLTISDACSRYALRCRAVAKTDGRRVKAVYEAVFYENGMPKKIRSDNGPPFASPAPGGLSRLSIWWLHLGIGHERIQPGHPEENGQQERLHQTLKQETASPPSANLRQQQQRFLRFEREYNYERPHEALQYRTPAEVYQPSQRIYSAQPAEFEYPKGTVQRHISVPGQLKWGAEKVFISSVLVGEIVGLIEQEEDFYEVYLGPILLGWLDTHELVFVADPGPNTRSSQRRQHQRRAEGTNSLRPSDPG